MRRWRRHPTFWRASSSWSVFGRSRGFIRGCGRSAALCWSIAVWYGTFVAGVARCSLHPRWVGAITRRSGSGLPSRCGSIFGFSHGGFAVGWRFEFAAREWLPSPALPSGLAFVRRCPSCRSICFIGGIFFRGGAGFIYSDCGVGRFVISCWRFGARWGAFLVSGIGVCSTDLFLRVSVTFSGGASSS